jgi:3-oxoacyl-[acyl-carrier protein] reductase
VLLAVSDTASAWPLPSVLPKKGKVVSCDVNPQSGEAAIKRLGQVSGFYKMDVPDRKAVRDRIQAVFSRCGRLDVLVNNAGVLRDNVLMKMKDAEVVKQMSEADFDLVIAVSLKGSSTALRRSRRL